MEYPFRNTGVTAALLTQCAAKGKRAAPEIGFAQGGLHLPLWLDRHLAMFNFMLADKFNLAPNRVASIVISGHVASLALLPLGLWLAH
jgi:hypothetical protein